MRYICSMETQHVDFIIVGHGIAGAVLANFLLSQNQTVHVIEKHKPNSASRVAAGIYNPVAYRSLKKAEFAETFIPEAKQFYAQQEQHFKSSFFSALPFHKLLTSIEEVNNWQIKSGEAQNAPFMSNTLNHDDFENGVSNPFGAGHVLQAGVLNTPKFLADSKRFLLNLDSFSDDEFGYNQLEISDTFIYKDIHATHIVFCEGIGIANNPWFNWLPIQQFKGEVLEIYAPDLKLTSVINKGVFILPMGNGYFKVGATHDWRNPDEQITEEGKQELLDKLNSFIQTPYKVTAHKAGLRPASRDRRAYIGEHPEISNMFVFNGLGSKGVITAPWLANHFFTHLPTKDWVKTFNITRFQKFYHTHDS